ncbi:hypothetical protein IP87_13565 [beta proteobacterium AAP121]|nr:hypothetical protein IP80_05300 [beta proteobacterium AAP65]KPF96646.1 hypothetical protein IP87_13565 [beta proteobacterium AAP121]
MSPGLLLSAGPELARVQHRLAVGVQCVDALSGQPLLAPLQVRLLAIGPLAADLLLQPKGDGRYSLADAGAFARLWDRCTRLDDPLPRTLDLLVHENLPGAAATEGEAPHRSGPRRVRMDLAETAPALPAPGFRPRPRPGRESSLALRLFPGPNHGFDASATVLRGRVQLGTGAADARPARWSRLVAMRGSAVLGHTQADERGEYALLLRYPAGLLAPNTPSPADAQIEVHIAARRNPPPHERPFDDLSAEPAHVVALDAPPPTDWPAAYDRRVTVARTVVFGGPNSGPAHEHLLAP